MRRVRLKATCGRGRKQSEWKSTLFEAMEMEFRRLRTMEVRVNRRMILEMVLSIVVDPNLPVSFEQIEQARGRSLQDVLKLNWVQSFLDDRKIITRLRTGNHKFNCILIFKNVRHFSIIMLEIPSEFAVKKWNETQ